MSENVCLGCVQKIYVLGPNFSVRLYLNSLRILSALNLYLNSLNENLTRSASRPLSHLTNEHNRNFQFTQYSLRLMTFLCLSIIHNLQIHGQNSLRKMSFS